MWCFDPNFLPHVPMLYVVKARLTCFQNIFSPGNVYHFWVISTLWLFSSQYTNLFSLDELLVLPIMGHCGSFILQAWFLLQINLGFTRLLLCLIFFSPPWTTLLSTTFHRFSARSSNLHSSRLLWMCVTISLPRSCLCGKKCIECTELNKTLPELYEICKKYLIFERYFTSLWFRGKKMVFHLSRSFCR